MKINVEKLNIIQARNCYSNTELTKKAGIRRATLTKIKQGLQMPTLKTIGKIAKALDVDVLEIVEQEN